MRKIMHVTDLMRKTSNVKILEKNENKLKIQIIMGSNKIVKIPSVLTKELSYVAAAVICDGHLKKDKYRICFENVNKDIIIKFIQKIYDVFETRANYRTKIDKRGGRKMSYMIAINSKPIVVFLNKIFEIPRGSKCDKVRVPEIIKNSELDIKQAFIEGVFDTDGGKRRRCLGLSSASKQFRDDLVELLSELGIVARKDEWINKKYNKRYYGLYFKVPKAGVPEWSKGQDYRF